MNRLWKPLFCLMLVQLMAACGEFEAPKQASTPAEREAAIEERKETTPPGLTPVEIDRAILSEYYTPEFLTLSPSRRDALARAIDAFQVVIRVDETEGGPGGGVDRISEIRAELHTSCSTFYFAEQVFSTPFSFEDISFDESARPHTIVELGGDEDSWREQGVQFEVICTSNSCDELVAAVRTDGALPRALMLIGLKGLEPQFSGRGYWRKYVPRGVEIDEFFVAPFSVDEILSQNTPGACQEEPDSDDPGDVDSPIGGEFEEVDPVEFPEANEDTNFFEWFNGDSFRF